MTRHEKILEARRLRDMGWTSPAIGRQLGVSDSTIRNWYLGGTCSCGAPITYDSPKYGHPDRCVACQPRAEHGTYSRYNSGCSCDDCRRASREQKRRYLGRTPPTHGASGYRNYGCRCDRCREGHLVYERSHNYEYKRAWRERRRLAAREAKNA